VPRLSWLPKAKGKSLCGKSFPIIRCCRHLLSTKPNGVEIQVYCGIIACLLIMLYTGRTPTKRTFEMVCLFLSGWASPEDLERHINALPKPV